MGYTGTEIAAMIDLMKILDKNIWVVVTPSREKKLGKILDRLPLVWCSEEQVYYFNYINNPTYYHRLFKSILQDLMDKYGK